MIQNTEGMFYGLAPVTRGMLLKKYRGNHIEHNIIGPSALRAKTIDQRISAIKQKVHERNKSYKKKLMRKNISAICTGCFFIIAAVVAIINIRAKKISS